VKNKAKKKQKQKTRAADIEGGDKRKERCMYVNMTIHKGFFLFRVGSRLLGMCLAFGVFSTHASFLCPQFDAAE
jgi:hypothetical protein